MSSADCQAQNELLESMLGDFLDESDQLLNRLNENLLHLDEWARSAEYESGGACDGEKLNEMFRAAHSLKGLSAMLGLNDINCLTHKLENVFDAARKHEVTIDERVVELMFASVDRLASMVEHLRDQSAEKVDYQSVVNDISQLLAGSAPPKEIVNPSDLISKADAAPPTRVPVVPPSDPLAGLVDESDVSEQYLAIFVDEAGLSLDRITEVLLCLEGHADNAAAKQLLGIFHQIKGSAASIGLNRAAKLAHLMEDAVQSLLDRQQTLAKELADALLKGTDALRQYVEGLRRGQAHTDSFSAAAECLWRAASPDTPAIVSPPPVAPPQAADVTRGSAASLPDDLRQEAQRRLAAFPTQFEPAFAGKVSLQLGQSFAGLKAQLIHEKLAGLGHLFYFHPPEAHLDELETVEYVAFGLHSTASPSDISQTLKVAGVREVILEPLTNESISSPENESASCEESASAARTTGEAVREQSPATAIVRAKDPVAEAHAKPAETLRVDVERLDELMNLAGQLVINKARFVQIGGNMSQMLTGKHAGQTLTRAIEGLGRIVAGSNDGACGGPRADWAGLRDFIVRIHEDLQNVHGQIHSLSQLHLSVAELYQAVDQLERISDGIQRTVMDTRMVPVGPLFTRFKRVVRDITRANGKNVRLIIHGEKTELDKRMIDELADPLIHLVRNAVDHGIESPADRAAAGKPTEGTVTLDAFHRGNRIIIQVCDDGKGLDAEKLKRKCLEKGVVTPAEAEKMTNAQVYQLIWRPGVSTADKVTEVSGRGMGMDIVKSKVENLNGTVELDSAVGKGTTFTITLPLTLAILPGLIVEIEGDKLVIPMESVTEIVHATRDDRISIHGLKTVRVRDRVLSLIRLSEVFKWNSASPRRAPAEADGLTLVIVREGGTEIGLLVDCVLGEEDVVVKSIAENFRNIPGLTGASILGDGRISLILDIPALIAMASIGNQAAVAAQETTA